jgi:hypothetical protein
MRLCFVHFLWLSAFGFLVLFSARQPALFWSRVPVLVETAKDHGRTSRRLPARRFSPHLFLPPKMIRRDVSQTSEDLFGAKIVSWRLMFDVR